MEKYQERRESLNPERLMISSAKVLAGMTCRTWRSDQRLAVYGPDQLFAERFLLGAFTGSFHEDTSLQNVNLDHWNKTHRIMGFDNLLLARDDEAEYTSDDGMAAA